MNKPFYNMDKYYDITAGNCMAPIFDEIMTKYPLKLKSVLDYGCGDGTIGIYLKQKTNCYLIGTEGSDYALGKAKESGYDKLIKLSDFCSMETPLEKESIDFIISKDVLEHLVDPLFVLREIQRLLSPKGMLLLHVPNHFPWRSRLKFLFTNNIDTQNYFPHSSDWDLPHIRFIRFVSLEKELNKLGFYIIENYSSFFTSYFPKTGKIPGLKHLQQLLANKYPDHFSIGFTILCKKK